MDTNKINELASAIGSKTWKGKSVRLFEGAGIIISNVQPTDTQGITVVVSNFANEISSLLFELKDLFAERLDYLNKYEFYGHLAQSANTYIEQHGDSYEVLDAIASEAVKISKEWCGTYYFAYGSNMDEAQLLERCPEARFVQTTKLHGYQFDLDSEGVATMRKNNASYVQGVVWLITEKDEKSLDDFEGVVKGCYEKSYMNIPIAGGEGDALTYLSLRGAYVGKNRDGYMDKIIKAAEKLCFDESYLAILQHTKIIRGSN